MQDDRYPVAAGERTMKVQEIVCRNLLRAPPPGLKLYPDRGSEAANSCANDTAQPIC